MQLYLHAWQKDYTKVLSNNLSADVTPTKCKAEIICRIA